MPEDTKPSIGAPSTPRPQVHRQGEAAWNTELETEIERLCARVGALETENTRLRAERAKARADLEAAMRQSRRLIRQLHDSKYALEQTNATKDRFFSILAHDLRSPFQSFLSITRLLIENRADLDEAEMMEMCAHLHRSSQSLFELLENLLEWASVQGGVTRVQPTDLRLTDLIEACTDLHLPMAESKRIELGHACDPDLRVRADQRMVETILRNLLTNALKFTHAGGRVLVEAAIDQSNSGRARISVRDNGIGMEADLVARIFALDAKTGRPGTGGEASCGLGLILSKCFAELNGGTLAVASEAGVGSVFTVTLPQP